MTVKTTLSFTNRHAEFLKAKVEEGVYASTSAAVAAAVEEMIRDEIEREAALNAMAEEIRARMATPREDYVDVDQAFAKARARVRSAGRG
ncbi:hypothetical protein [Caenispirillum salinarum]|uniref:hypothetical protein n=1 Tax=Caenispirillum salinarum TaxID=859058 RepID=UPI00384DB798